MHPPVQGRKLVLDLPPERSLKSAIAVVPQADCKPNYRRVAHPSSRRDLFSGEERCLIRIGKQVIGCSPLTRAQAIITPCSRSSR